ncbi:MAG TPA: tRNA (adenosine(37)-N6)-dimethylallyltransferase MiaA [Bacteroidales bacterium]|nr:tRNA (adenosine(37)-N6)-dimethylallyltransferase MiaA [Bacteroidales bacterium]HOU01438.1 tRNA (adenosine(37)-N6)-dimethylallyltransferase MiaA [Bacteroidales bacterium]HQG62867.1 tRNA (adenosine(37)-N6)-dimethylallyltransferase MiaA [Bacteroidales bacterium]HQK68014.1 tRNA (adenosine(37)-N6)-dimethylallyltransferase MiaA [Bacteroidales bacterium]
MSSYDLLVVTGPTASGKTSLAVALADLLDGEIISADSRQVYRGMDLGTGKDYDEYFISGRRIPCHLIDIADPGYKYNLFEYQRDFIEIYRKLKEKDIFPVVCGGSGMYIDSIVKGYEMFEVPPDSGLRARLEKKSMEELINILSTYKKLHNVTDIDTKKRVIRAIEIEHFNHVSVRKQKKFPPLKPLVIGIMVDREVRRKRISERLLERLRTGMVDEVRGLLDSGVNKETLIYYGLEYKYITLYLTGVISYETMVSELETAIHQFAKRQMTWFRGMERKGTVIHWIDERLPKDEKVAEVLKLLQIGFQPAEKLLLPDQ